MSWYFTCLLLLFLFRTNGKKGHLDENNFRPCYHNIFRKWHSQLDHSQVQSPSSINTRHIANSILKNTLQFFILRTWINMRAKSFIKTSVNFTETRIDKGAWKKRVTQSVHLEEHCTKIENLFHLICAPLYLTSLVFKFITVLIGIFLKMSATIYLFAFWLTFYISLVLKFIQCLYAFYKE